MKKMLCLLLVAVMVLGLCACGGSDKDGDTAVKGLQVGYARENIHPEESVPLGGYGNSDTRMSQGFLDYLQATCIAFREGENTTLLYTIDIISCSDWALTAREKIAQAVGLPIESVMLSATHSHSTPDMNCKVPSITNYKILMEERLISAAKAAIADLAPAKLYSTRTQSEGLNFIRHYTMNDGTVSGDNFGSSSSGYKGHAAEVDEQIQIMKITREGKKDIVMMNWQAHPCNTGGMTKTDLSADFVGVVRTELESKTDCLFAYFQGAAGNHNAKSYIPGEHHNLDHYAFGQKLASYVIDALPNVTEIKGGAVQTKKTAFTFNVNHDKEDLQFQAREVRSLFESTGNRDQANALARSYGISSIYEANAILARPSRPQTAELTIYATRIGDFAFVNAPYEMFADSGRYIKENSPYEMTFVISCSNGANGYFAMEEAYDYGCYESFTSYYAKGIAEEAHSQFVSLLESMQ